MSTKSPNKKLTPPPDSTPGFQRLVAIVQQLRSPQGCPWDREQTPRSLRAAFIEETYEAVDAINSGDLDHIREELGDAYLMVTMISEMYDGYGDFSIEQILQEVCEKLIRRHPHVYGDSIAENPEEVVTQWQHIKENLEGRKKTSILDKVSHALPPLERAYQLQRRAAKAGFDWTKAEPVWDKISEELEETRQAWRARELSNDLTETQESFNLSKDHLEEELGDLLFSVVNVARFLKIDPAIALQRSNAKFDKRFRFVEKAMENKGIVMGPETFEEMDALWESAKKQDGNNQK